MASDSALYSAIAFITALQLHEQLGLTSAQTGAALLPMSLGIVATGTLLAPRLRRRYGSVLLTAGGLLIGRRRWAGSPWPRPRPRTCYPSSRRCCCSARR
jgi:hypothetical protein